MKKLWLLATIVFVWTIAGELFAQTKDDIYYVNIPIVKILKHRMGYKIFYAKNDMKIASVFVPIRWMVQIGGKGMMIWGKESSYPYMSVYWIDKKFDHVRLYLKPLSDESWGVLDASDDEVRASFNVEELKIEQ
jgi:hypothetical protein